jgi:cystathionine gamma-synthase
MTHTAPLLQKSKPLAIETLAVHAGFHVDPQTKSLSQPIHMATTFEHPADSALNDGYLYQRYTNPTQEQLEAALGVLEGGGDALFFATGLAAAAAMLHTLKPGDRVILADDTYFAIRKLFVEEGGRMGLRCELVDLTDPTAVHRAFATNAAMVWMETPSNPLIKVTDVEFVANAARSAGAKSVVDATFATPILLKPLDLGADVVLHSTTKYLSGHSDNMGGSLVTRDANLRARLFELRKLLGGTASPFAAWLTLRGIRTLPCRLAWHCDSAEKIAAFLNAHPAVEKTHYPGLSSHAGHAIAARQMRRFGGMLSLQVKGDRARAILVAGRLQLFTNATSLGSTESLVEHRQSVEGPTSTTPANLLRLSIGLEHVDDLIADLAQALAVT